MPGTSYLVKKQATATDVNGETHDHLPGTVVSDWELNDYIKGHIAKGTEHYRQLFEPLTDEEAKGHRVKATAALGPLLVADRTVVNPPWDDYVGLHPTEIMRRMDTAPVEQVKSIRAYEAAYLGRSSIADYVAPSEREPWAGYDNSTISQILEKMSVMDDKTCGEAVIYEMAHSRRPAIITWDRLTYEGTTQEPEAEIPDGIEGDEDEPSGDDENQLSMASTAAATQA